MMPDLFARLGGAYLASQADTPQPGPAQADLRPWRTRPAQVIREGGWCR